MTSLLTDRTWRLNNLIWIRDAETGQPIQFRMNASQRELLANLHYKNIILKARQLGFTTQIQALITDTIRFLPDQTAGVIAHKDSAAKDIMRNKIKFAMERLPDPLIPKMPLDNVRSLELDNGSAVYVDTSLRSGTYQILHISEYGKISARNPAAADEIKTGALNTVAPNCFVFVESTAEGHGGNFYDMVKTAQDKQASGAPLTPMDYRLHFFGWHKEPRYSINPESIIITKESQEYFEELQHKHGIELSDGQKAWYVVKSEEQGEFMRREFPSVIDEAFEAPIKGAYYSKEMHRLRRRRGITQIRHDPMRLVHTAWDLGVGAQDAMAVWFFQIIGQEIRLIWYEESNGLGLLHYAGELRRLRQENGWQYGTHLGPHDVDNHDLGTGERRSDYAADLGLEFAVVPRTTDKAFAIDQTRRIFPRLVIDEQNCAIGIARLDNYQRQWDDKRGVFKSQPLRNEAKHGADALETLARGLEYIDDYAAEPMARKLKSDRRRRAMGPRPMAGSY